MVLNSEEQRELLLQIIQSTNINGTYNQAKEAVKMLDQLFDNVKNAEIKQT